MQKSIFDELTKKSISLLGYGVSNRAVCEYLLKKGILPKVRNEKPIPLPKGASGVFGGSYLDAHEDIVFRSPSIRADNISKNSRIYTEISFSLEHTVANKIGITGSDGKTTTSSLINEILRCDGKLSYLVGNIGNPLISYIDSIKNDDFLVCELSSFQLYDYTPSLDCAVITSISENHLDWHKSHMEYVLSKGNITKNAKCVVAYHDLEYRELFEGGSMTYFSLSDLSECLCQEKSYVYIKNGKVYFNKDALFSVDIIKLKGEYNLLNALAAVGATYKYVKPDSIVKALSGFSGVGDRCELVATKNGVKFINSSADSTPTRTKNTLSVFPKEKTIAILGGYDKNLSYDILNEALNGVRAIVLMGENREKIYKSIEKRKEKIIKVNTLNEATYAAYKEAKDGDYVVLSPASASFDMFKNYKERAESFKDFIKGL